MTSYNEALESLAQSSGSVIHRADLTAGPEYEDNYPVDKENELFDAVKRGELEEAVSAANQFFDWMTENYGSPLGYITRELGVTEEALNELRDKFLE